MSKKSEHRQLSALAARVAEIEKLLITESQALEAATERLDEMSRAGGSWAEPVIGTDAPEEADQQEDLRLEVIGLLACRRRAQQFVFGWCQQVNEIDVLLAAKFQEMSE